MDDLADLAAWLDQILKADQAAAQAATEGPWKWQELAPPHKYGLVGGHGRVLVVPSRTPDVYPSVSDARFMEANDPSKVLARIAADRQILALHKQAWDRSIVDDPDPEGSEWLLGRRWALHEALKLLALPHADRPGYREAWRP